MKTFIGHLINKVIGIEFIDGAHQKVYFTGISLGNGE